MRRPVPAVAAAAAADLTPRGTRRNLSDSMTALLDLGPAAFGERYATHGRPDRSRAVWALLCAMVRANWPDAEAVAALLAAPWVAATEDRHGDVHAYVARLLPRARAQAADDERRENWSFGRRRG